LLVCNGLFPTAPSQPCMAISVEHLGFYHVLFECSCDAINALASMLHTQYIQQGFHLTKKDNLGHAIQWYDILQVEIEKNIADILQGCWDAVSSAKSYREPLSSLPSSLTKHNLSPGSCVPILVQYCPVCFRGQDFGCLLDNGSDIHIAMDGNFHHHHWHSAGDCLAFYNPVYFLPKSQVDDVGQWIDTTCKCPPQQYNMLVPDEAIDQCETLYEVADGKKQKAVMDSFSIALFSQLMTYPMSITMLQMRSSGKIPHGLSIGRRKYGLS
ncbi:hypothetical protein EDC04DRAFT_2588476, partial [Pisolithus marmoratus]